MKKINLSIVGIGRIGNRHLKIILSKKLKKFYNLVAICETDQKKNKKVKKNYKS